MNYEDERRAIELSDAAGRALTNGLLDLAEKLKKQAERLLGDDKGQSFQGYGEPHMTTKSVKDFITLFESGQQSAPVLASTANDLAESLGGKPCITAHRTDQSAAMVYLVALVSVKIAATGV
ncbi:hypothetical protein ORA50_07590 [Pseudomonas carnis]|nr:hypothetical protein [Pseudomonas carnis]MDW8840094.1 hypothetical protein [Pseudomonas carnis]